MDIDIEKLPPELKERACACRTVEELYALLREEGMEIPDEELEGIAGGAWCNAFRLLCGPHGCEQYAPKPCIK